MIPNRIAISTVDIGLLVVPKTSIAKTLFIPWENKKKINAKVTPGKILLKYNNFDNTLYREI